LPAPTVSLGHLVECRRERGVGTRIVAVQLCRVADERETPARRGADARSSGARHAHAVGGLRMSRLDEIANALSDDPAITGNHGAETVEQCEELRSRRDDLARLGRRVTRSLLKVAIATDDSVASSRARQLRVRQESSPEGLEVALRPMRAAQRS